MSRTVNPLIAFVLLVTGTFQTLAQEGEQAEDWDMLAAKPEVIQQWQDMRFGMFLH